MTPNSKVMKMCFPEEIIVEILIRLPVLALVRFKCASKSWKTLITSDYFKAKHCNHAKNNKKFLIARCVPGAGSYSYYCFSLSSAQPLQKLSSCPSNQPDRYYEILCCCDGLSLLLCRDGYLLWNPSINESIQLPNLSAYTTYNDAAISTYGMEYDSISDDYKILKIDNNNVDSKILALKSGSWRKIDKHPRVFRNIVHHEDPLAFVRGAFHWISEDNLCKYFMISFSISNEVYEEMSLPEGICNIPSMVYNIRCGVSAIQGMLYAYCTCMDNGTASTFKLWVMKDYGVEESWTGLFTIQERAIYLSFVMPKYMFADGQMLLMYQSVPVCGFRTSKGPPFELFPANLGFFQQGFVYSESLISPKLLI